MKIATGSDLHLEFKGLRTLTCLALGPDNAEKLNIITGHLKLL